MADSGRQRVQFYVLPGADAPARLKVACRLIEEAYLAGENVYVWLDDPNELSQFDEMLWTFADRSFVPHERFVDAQQWQEIPVLLSCEAQPESAFDLLINLGAEVPAAAAQARRVTEIIDGDEPRRRQGRLRFRHYREQGLTPETQNISSEPAT